MNTYADELKLAKNIAVEVGTYQLKEQKNISSISLKSDRSPVTEVDENSEKMIRDAICAAYPQDGFLGEEGGEKSGSNQRKWIVDPIDGTRPYIRGIPTFSTLIALEDAGRIVAGVVNLPALGECYYAARGSGAYCNGAPVQVSSTPNISKAMGAFLGLTETYPDTRGETLLRLSRDIDYTYGFMDAYSYMAVASGKLDLCVGLIDFPWDRAPAAIIIEEAGGVATDIFGDASIYGSSYVVSNGRFHKEILDYFNKGE
ncbi:MAG: inositol monophosphatase family protein [Fibrobacterota bacterium]